MNDHPAGDELLSTARRVLLDRLLPVLPPDRLYETLMVANAMAIAGRELAATDQDVIDIDQSLSDFYRKAGLGRQQDESDIVRDLALKIRHDDIPPDLIGSLRALLLSIAQRRLLISNPKYLDHEPELLTQKKAAR